MRKSEYTKLLAGLLFCASLVLSAVPAGAQIVVANPEGTKHNIKTFMNNIKESKFVLDTTAFINKTSSTLGDAKRSVTEYVVKNKEKLEKKMEKVEKYKKRAEEYKKDYEEYKKWADENIAEAKRMKELAEEKYNEAQQMKSDISDGINTAKQIAGQAGDTVSGLKDVAQSKIGSAAGSVGINTGGSSSSENISGSANVNTGSAASGNYAATGTGGAAASATSGRLPFADPQTANSVENLAESSAGVDNSIERTNTAGAGTAATATDKASSGGIADSTNSSTANAAVQGNAAKTETLEDKVLKYGKELSEKTAGGAASSYKNSAASSAIQVSPAVQSNVAVNGNVLQKRTTVQDIRQASPHRRNFKTRAQSAGYEKQSLVVPELKSFASLTRAEPLAFASLLSLPDGGEDANGTYIVPKSVNMPCGLNSSKALEEGAMDKCLTGFMESSMRAQVTEAGDQLKIYHQGLKELTAAYIAEAYQAQINTSEFTDKILDSIDMAPTPSGLDIYGVLVEANKAVVGTMNGLLKMYSSRLAMISYKKYGDYRFTSPDFEKE